MIDIDFETRSKVDIKMGPWRYASDPSTQIMCMAYKIGSRPTLIWAPGDPMPAFVQKRMWDVLGIRAHNAMFERAVWSEICVKRFGWPEIDESQWSCSAAKCAAHSLPRDLQRACMVMNTEVQKDMSGKRVMLKLSKPRKETKNNAKQWHYDIDVPEDFETLYKYCMMDVESEYSLDHAVRDLSAKEQQIWQLDQTINSRGICVDTEAVRGAIEIIDAYEKQASPKLARLSDGAFNKVSQVAAIRRWMAEKGRDTESLDKEAVEALLSVKELPSEIREVLHIRQSLGKTSTKKLYAMLNAICPDGRVKDLLMYHGASTGRWSGKNIQVQNFPRRKVEDLDAKMKLLGEGNLEKVQLFHGDPMDLISSCLRGMIVAAPGKRLYVADYAAIEARGVCWLAGQESTLQLFRDNKDVYRVMASTIYSKPLSQVDGGEKDGQERQLGKQAVLGCLAENTLIYSDTGIKYIQDLGTEDKIWNGKAFVKHGGIKATGEKSVIEVPSLRLTATPDHLILSSRGWRTLAEIVIDGDMTPLKLVRFLDGGRLQDESSKRAQNVMSPCSAVAGIRKALESTNYGWERLKAVIHALNPEMDVKGESQAYTTILSLIHDFAHDGERLGTTLKNVVKTQVTHFFGTMVLEAYRSPSNPVESSWNTLLSWMGTILGISRSIELTRTGGTNEAISAWSLLQKTTKTVQCFDILNVEGGYFQAGNVFAHNCGYSMGPPKFQATCEKYKMQVDLPLAERAVSAYRETNDKVVSMWYEQERAAKTALRERKGIKCGYTKWGVVGKFLYCKLPSGRTLAYPKARLVHGDTPWGEKRAQVEYMGLNTSNQWVAIRTYGGKIVENITQAVCRDIMAEAMLRLEAAGYRILFTVHDEIICETDDNFGSIEEFIKLLTEVPSWAKGFPIKAEGWSGYRYRK